VKKINFIFTICAMKLAEMEGEGVNGGCIDNEQMICAMK